MFEVLIQVLFFGPRDALNTRASQIVKRVCRQAGRRCSTKVYETMLGYGDYGAPRCRHCDALYHVLTVDAREYSHMQYCSGCGSFLWMKHAKRHGDILSFVSHRILRSHDRALTYRA
jgi:hypothetical protein